MGIKTKTGLVLLVSIVVSPAFADDITTGGSVNFAGTVVDAPCIIAPDSTDMTVNLGQTTVNYLNQNTNSKPVDINIHLTNCSLSGAGTGGADITKAHFQFDSSSVLSMDSTVLANTISDGAQGIGVEILEGNKVVILGSTGTPDLPLQVSSSEQTLTFQGRMVNAGAIDSGQPAITPGAVSTNATYVISYQ